ncbi:hypothetical protein WN51_10019 [Melipona quadrifasciata]|uniref:Uncharacterized protein n=1 Tax=Melipona quadrifasciata TaxID=166423 RepID=A0A0N0U7M6_9HYME|nr:hypothetical protein WN51_10019 [Melipona quadrifasciata]
MREPMATQTNVPSLCLKLLQNPIEYPRIRNPIDSFLPFKVCALMSNMLSCDRFLTSVAEETTACAVVVLSIEPTRFQQLSLLSPTFDGGAGLIGIKLDLLTNPPTNMSNGKLLINNDAHETSRDVEERDTKDETAKAGVEVTHGTQDIVTSTDTTSFLRGIHTRKSENLDDSDDQRNASSSSHSIHGGNAPPILELGVTRRLSESSIFRDDPPVSSTSRTHDGHFSETIANTAGDLTSTSPTAPHTAHQIHWSPTSLNEVRNINRHVIGYKRIAITDAE